jgi:transposase
VPQLPNLDHLSHAEKDTLIRALWTQVQVLTARVAALEAKLGEPSKTPDNSSLPPSKGQKPSRPEKGQLCTLQAQSQNRIIVPVKLLNALYP